MAKEVEVKIKVTGAEQANKAVNKVADSSTQATAAAGGMGQALDGMLGGAVSGFRRMVGGVRSAIGAMKTLRGAVIATGVGALVVAVASLVSYFTKTQRGAEMLEKATAVLGVVFGKLMDVVSGIGEVLVGAFQNPQQALQDLQAGLQAVQGWFSTLGTYIKDTFLSQILGLRKRLLEARIAWNEWTGDSEEAEGLKAQLADLQVEIDDTNAKIAEGGQELAAPFVAAAAAVQEFAGEVAQAGKDAAALATASIALRKAQRELRVETAESRAAINEYRIASRDTTLSLEERLAAAEAAIAMERHLMEEQQALAEEELRIHRQQIALTESTEEDYEKLADLEAAVAQGRARSLRRQKEMQQEVITLRKEATAATEAQLKSEQELLAAQQERETALQDALESDPAQREIDAAVRKYEALFALAEEFGYGEQELAEQQAAAVAAITAKYAAKEADAVQKAEERKTRARHATIQQSMQLANALLQFAQTMNDRNESEDIAAQKRQFKRGKALQVAGAVMSTAQAVIAALAAPPVGLGWPAGLPGSITAGLTGAAQIAAITAQQFPESGAVGATSVPGVTTGSASSAMQAALVPTNFADAVTAPTTPTTPNDSPVRAYVVAQDVTNQQAIDSAIAFNATLQ